MDDEKFRSEVPMNAIDSGRPQTTGDTFIGTSHTIEEGIRWNIDIIASISILIIVTFPNIVTTMTDGGGFFTHQRIGRYNKPFGCLKFRTMVKDADDVRSLLPRSADIGCADRQ